MKKKKFEPSAFPYFGERYDPVMGKHKVSSPCMTLRDYFAGQALVGILTNAETGGDSPHQTALVAYIMADAMLRERDNEE